MAFRDLLTPEQRARIAEERAKLERESIVVTARRFDCNHDWAERAVEVRIRPDGEWAKIIEGGVTGYESIPIDKLDLAIERAGWLACMGTEPAGPHAGWDKLIVDADELRKVKAFVESVTP